MFAAADIAWVTTQAVRRIAAGTATCVLIALAATFVATLHSGPPMLYALFFGTAFHYQSTEARTAPGIDFCSRTLLRLGVGLPPLSKENDRFMLCGSPEMLRDTRALFDKLGMTEGNMSHPGHFVIERAFVEK